MMVLRRKITPKNPTKNSKLDTIMNSLIPIVIIILENLFLSTHRMFFTNYDYPDHRNK